MNVRTPSFLIQHSGFHPFLSVSLRLGVKLLSRFLGVRRAFDIGRRGSSMARSRGTFRRTCKYRPPANRETGLSVCSIVSCGTT